MKLNEKGEEICNPGVQDLRAFQRHCLFKFFSLSLIHGAIFFLVI